MLSEVLIVCSLTEEEELDELRSLGLICDCH